MNQLPSSKKWFDIPKKEMDSILICKASGFLANTNCSETEKCFLPTASINATACPYHQLIAIDKNTNQRVNMNATAIDNMQLKSYFVLPPLMEKYFISNHVDYEQVPKFAEGVGQIKSSIEVLYPLQNQNIIVGINNKFIATAHATSAVFWHLDNQFLGTTSHFHEKEIATSKGKHTLNISDTYGSSKDIIFFVK